jgi:dihydrolipoamide dehydrogenase|tara:strand:+ start:1832 stop:3250 length:1419 start_codon:yes stop_codon:yes gene_type:complete
MSEILQTEIAVIGAGPGGYAAAFRAADLGKKVVLIDKEESLGGVCLNRGCIPSKALLHLSKLIGDAKEAKKKGVNFGNPEISLPEIRKWKNSIISNLSSGILQLAKARNVKALTGHAQFLSEKELEIKAKDTIHTLSFEKAIIATGSVSAKISILPNGSHQIMDSKRALELSSVPEKLLVIGGGYIGLELGSVYSALGSKVSVVEMLPHILAGADRDLVKPLQNKISRQFENIYLETELTSGQETEKGIQVKMKTKKGEFSETYDAVLVSVGRKPNTQELETEKAGIEKTERGFLEVNKFQQTSISNIYAIGDITGEPMLAHKAAYEGIVAAEHISGLPSQFDARAVPAVVFTSPEIAWAGLTETEAREKSIAYEKGDFPWVASGKAMVLGFREGKTKILFDPKTKQMLGAGIVGPSAGDLISEMALAIEMGADAEDIGQTIHPHPTTSETMSNAADVFLGTATDIFIPKNK